MFKFHFRYMPFALLCLLQITNKMQRYNVHILDDMYCFYS